MLLSHISPKQHIQSLVRFASILACIVGCTLPHHLFGQSAEWRTLGVLRQARHSFGTYSLGNSRAIVFGGYTGAFGGTYTGTPLAASEIVDVDKRTITTGASMNEARAEFASVQLPDGSVVVISGFSIGGKLTSGVEIYDPELQQWRKMGDVLIARRQHTACLISPEEILVVGGRLANLNSIAASEIFNIRTGQSRRIADFPYPINTGVSVFTSSGHAIAFGGRSGSGDSYRTTAIYEYDGNENQWRLYGNMSAAVQAITIMQLSDGRMVASGGTARESFIPFLGNKSVSIEAEAGLSLVASMQIDRVWHSMAEWNKDSILTIGGLNNSNGPTKSVDWINIANNQSTSAPVMPIEHSHGQALSMPARDARGNIKPRVLMISGFAAGYKETTSIEILERVTDSITVPTISSFTPTRGTTGTTVVISGTGFTGTTSVSFGDISAASFRVDAPTQITAVVAAGASGAVRVSTPAGSAEKSGFIFAAPMQVTTVAGGMGRGIYHIVQDEQKNFYIPAQDQGKIYRVTPSGQVSTFFSVPPKYCTLMGGIARDKQGNFYVSYTCDQGTILKISPDGKQSSVYYQNSSVGGVYGLEFDAEGNLWGVCSKGAIGSLIKITSTATTVVYQGSLIAQGFSLKLDGRGNVYVPSYTNQHIVKFSACGVPTIFYNGNLISYPQGIVIGESGNVYVASADSETGRAGHVLTKITPNGEASIFAGSGRPGYKDGSLREAQFNGAVGLFFDESGDIYLTDYYSGYLRKISNVGELPLNTKVQLYAGPQFTDFLPISGTSGTVVTLRGNNFSCVKEVTIGGVPVASFSIVSDNEIRAVVGAGATGAIRLTAPTGTASKETFTFLSPPIITSINPTRVIVGATIVLNGRNFLGATSVRFGAIEASIFSVDADSRITAIIPVGVTSSTVSVQTPGGTATYIGLSVAMPPVITALSATTASMGDSIVIYGRHFTGASTIQFGTTTNSVRAISFHVVSDSVIVAVVGSGASGSVFVTTPAGIAERQGFRFINNAPQPPSIFTFTPTQASTGTLINIIGRGFTGATSVQFGSATNATLAASFLVRSDSLIVATLGVGATGNVTVISTTGIATRPGFVYLVPTTPISTTPTVVIPPRTDSTGTNTGTGTSTPLILPTITSIAPSCVAGSRLLTITGTGFTGRPEVRFGRLASGTNPSRLLMSPSVGVSSTTQLIVVVPSGLVTYTGLPSGSKEFGISLSTTTGTATRSGLQYIENAPVINAFSPSSATNGDKLYIVGQGFTCVSDVRVGGSTVASYIVVSDTLVVATLGQTANGTVRLTTPAGVAERGGFVYSVFPMSLLPNITSFSPTAARVGQTITITGVNFSGTNANGSPFTTTSLSLGGVSVPFTVVSPTQITVRLPNDFFTTGTDVRLSTPGGSVAAQGFTFIPEPVITSFTPESASTGTIVLISGRNFTGTTSVQFGGASAQSFTVLADTLIQAVVGDGASGSVRVTTPNGTATRAGFTFVIPPPFITSFTPTLFAASTTITITGRNFVGNGYTTQLVLIGNVAGTIISVSPTTLVVRAPAKINSTTITVITPGGTANACCLTLPQAMMPMQPQPPRILGFSPASSGVGGTVTIRGENFTGATEVRFGGVAATSFRVVSSTEIQAVVGAGATGEISVRTPIGLATFNGFTFILPPQPIITGFSPATGAAGDTVRVRGQYLQTVSSFTILGDPNVTVNATFTTSGDTLVTAVLGTGQSFSLGTINLRTLGGTARATGFTFIAAPVITSFSPVIAGMGDAVVINGAGFDNVQLVAFGNPPNLVQAASYVVNSPSRITASLGVGATGSVVVTTRGGSASRAGFVFAPVPVITRFTPDSARASDVVRIVGSGFLSQSAVSVVNFGNVRAASWTVVSDSVITASPAQTGATGSISLTTPGGTAQRSGFVFLAPLPTITSFSPQQASVGDIVTIIGTNLNGATSVSFGGRAAASFLVSSPTQIVARVSNGTSGTITVQTPGGRATAPNFVFIPAPPVITSFTPDSAGAGQTITLRGRDFSGISSVRFMAGTTTLAAQSFSITNDSTMTARVPALSTSRVNATVTVQSPNGAGSREGLQFIPAPTITSFTPASATAGTTVVLTGTNFNAATAVRFGGTNARSLVVNSDTQISATIGAGASGAISVVTAGGTASRTGFTFLVEQVVIPAPVITSFSPQEAPANATVTITGTNFTGSGLSGITGVLFGGVAAQSYAVLSPTTITAVVGTGASGSITVSSARGNATLTGFRFIPAPVITDFTPKSAGRGATVNITGRNFAGLTSVSFGGTAVQFTVSGDTPPSDTLIRATLQIGSTGAVSVTTPGGTATMAGFTFATSIIALSPKNSETLTDVRLEASAQSTLRVYPNPANDLLTIEATLPCAAQPVRLILRNALGAAVLTLEAQSAEGLLRKELNVAQLSSGAYSVELSCGVERLVGRFVRF